MPFRPPSQEVVDAEYVAHEPERGLEGYDGYADFDAVNQVKQPAGTTILGGGSGASSGPAPMQGDPYGQPLDLGSLAAAVAQDRRARAISLFVEVPLLAFVAMMPEVPGLVRLVAAGLGAYKVTQLTQSQQDFDALLSQGQ